MYWILLSPLLTQNSQSVSTPPLQCLPSSLSSYFTPTVLSTLDISNPIRLQVCTSCSPVRTNSTFSWLLFGRVWASSNHMPRMPSRYLFNYGGSFLFFFFFACFVSYCSDCSFRLCQVIRFWDVEVSSMLRDGYWKRMWRYGYVKVEGLTILNELSVRERFNVVSTYFYICSIT